MADVASLRMRHKRHGIAKVLHSELVRKHVVTARFGELLLLQLPVTNSSAAAQTYRVEVRAALCTARRTRTS